ncbi:MAG: sterol desaturase family protein [Spongiibacteraceae bacterium]
MIKNIAAYMIFPTLMASGLATTLLLLQRGVDPALAATVSVVCWGLLLIPLLERWLPYRADWNQPDKDVGTDLIHMLVNAAIPKLWTPLQIAALAGATVWASEYFGSSLWPVTWHWLPELFLMLLIAEFGRYWIHYAAHKLPILWRFHAVHHSPKRLYFLNANRFHPLEKLLFQIPEVAPFIVLGTPVEIIALYFTFNGLHGLMQHCNINLRLGWLNYVFSMTELHRWHHSQIIEESDRNFGNNLICWDLLFGSYFNPKARQVNCIGLLNSQYPKSWWRQMLAPFSRKELSKPDGFYDDKSTRADANG